MTGAPPKGRLSRKYVVALVALVGGVLVASGIVELYLSYQETRRAVVSMQREKAVRAAERIEQFVGEIERHVRGTTHAATGTFPADLLASSGFNTQEAWRSFLAEQREIAFLQMLRNAPAVMELRHLDESGRERIRVSRLALDAIGSGAYYFETPAFRAARGGKVYYGPVTFRNDSEPYMELAVPSGNPTIEVTVADINLKAIWDVISRIRVGQAGYAYVVDSMGRLIAHPDVSLVLQMRDLSTLPQVKAARESATAASSSDESFTMLTTGLDGTQSLATHAAIPALGWYVIVEQPLSEAYAPLRIAMLWGMIIMAVGLALSVLVSIVLARRMVAPIRTLQAGAARIGAGDLGHRIEVRTGDELEALAAEFNHTTEQLQESQRDLEQKVQARTADLTQSLEQQTATSEILRAISGSPTDVQPVLDMMAKRATQLCNCQFCAVFRFDGKLIHLVAHEGLSPEGAAAYERLFPLPLDRKTAIGRAIQDRTFAQIPDIEADPDYGAVSVARAVTYRAILAVPLLRDGRPIGGIAVSRASVGPFPERHIDLLHTFADQAVIAIGNVQLFNETKEALEQQTATSEILRVISQSQTDAQPVFDTIVRNAVELCDAIFGAVFRFDGEFIYLAAHHNMTPGVLELLGRLYPMHPSREQATGRVILTGALVHVHDAFADPEYNREVATRGGWHSMLAVPMSREGAAVGVIWVARATAGPFPDNQIALLQTFADQAVIAIENVRVFNELEARTEELTRSIEEMRALGEVGQAVSSTLDLDTVLSDDHRPGRRAVAGRRAARSTSSTRRRECSCRGQFMA